MQTAQAATRRAIGSRRPPGSARTVSVALHLSQRSCPAAPWQRTAIAQPAAARPPVRGLGARCGSVTPAASLALLRRPVVRCAHPCTRRGPSAPGTGPESAPGRFRLRPWRRRRGRPPGVVAWSESHTATTPAAALRGAGGGCCWPVTPAGPLALYGTSMGGCALARRPAGQPIGPRAGLPSRAWPRLRPRGEASPGPRGRSALRCRCCRGGVGQGGGPGGGLSCPSGALEAAAAHDRPEGS